MSIFKSLLKPLTKYFDPYKVDGFKVLAYRTSVALDHLYSRTHFSNLEYSGEKIVSSKKGGCDFPSGSHDVHLHGP